MFTPSITTISGAVQEIADSIGASADHEMRNRALRSLAAAFKHLNSRYRWPWLLTEGNPITVIGPFGVAITAGASGIASASAVAGHGVKVDDLMIGAGFALGTRVSATAAAVIGFNASVTGIDSPLSTTVSAYRDFYDFPSDFKQMYSFRSLGNLKALYPAQRRAYDRTIDNEFLTDTPSWYDIFSQFQRSKVRLLPVPNGSDILQLRYYRRMTVASASAQTDVLDIPQDYDYVPIAWAKWHFITDKNEGRGDQATTWLTLANEGIRTMMADVTHQADEDLGFTPGRGMVSWSRSSTRYPNVSWDYT